MRPEWCQHGFDLLAARASDHGFVLTADARRLYLTADEKRWAFDQSGDVITFLFGVRVGRGTP